MKKFLLVLTSIFVMFCSNTYALEYKPYVGLAFIVPMDLELANASDSDEPSIKNNYKIDMENSPGLVFGFIHTDKIKSSVIYYESTMKVQSKYQYRSLSLSIDYLLLNFGNETHQGIYAGLGAVYNSYNDKSDFMGKDNILGALVKAGIEYKIGNYLIDFGYTLNFIDEPYNHYSSADGYSYYGDLLPPDFFHFTLSYIF